MKLSTLVDPVQTLNRFFSMTEAQISRDLASVRDNYNEVRDEVAAFHTLCDAEQTPQRAARYLHNMMLTACVIDRCDRELNRSPDLTLFYISFVVAQVTGMASGIARKRGRVAQLARCKLPIHWRDGGPQEIRQWPVDQRPSDHRDARGRHEALLRKIDQMVWQQVLHRYRLHELADLCEKDRMRHQVMLEVGRRQARQHHAFNDQPQGRCARVLFDPRLDAQIEESLLSQHGQAAIDLLNHRLTRGG